MSRDNKPLDLVRVKSIINNFDFGYVVDRAIKTGMPPQVTLQALAEFKEFLFAHATHPTIPLVPQSCWCDDLWHEFIVADTRAYFRFCEAAFGHYLHHDGVNATAAELAGYRAHSATILGEAAAECNVPADPADPESWCFGGGISHLQDPVPQVGPQI
jgi:hypothetical protein